MYPENRQSTPDPVYEYQYLRAAGPGGGRGREPSFFRRHWFLTLCLLGLGLGGSAIFYLTGGRPMETAQNYLDELAGKVEVQVEPAEAEKSYWDLAVDDHLALRPLVEKVFVAGTEYKMRLYSEAETAALKRRHPALAESRNYFTRLGNVYIYISPDGQRIYDCEMQGELLADKAAREALEASAQNESAREAYGGQSSRDESGIIIYSPSDISGDSLDNLSKDQNMKGIFRDADGTWRNY